MHLQPWFRSTPLQLRHNERDSVSNHQPHDCLFNCLWRRRSKKTSKPRWPENSPHKGPVTRKMFPLDDVIMPSNNILIRDTYLGWFKCFFVVQWYVDRNIAFRGKLGTTALVQKWYSVLVTTLHTIPMILRNCELFVDLCWCVCTVCQNDTLRCYQNSSKFRHLFQCTLKHNGI